jgi:hypothetical protein
MTSDAELKAAHGSYSYSLTGLQGYIYRPCATDCLPPGTDKLWRGFKSTENDCAVWIESEAPAFALYNQACPGAAGTGPTLLGYAYTAGDTDGDGLPNAMEYVIGTAPTLANSDGANGLDGTDFPMTGISFQEPCSGSAGALHCYLNDVIFDDSFEYM